MIAGLAALLAVLAGQLAGGAGRATAAARGATSRTARSGDVAGSPGTAEPADLQRRGRRSTSATRSAWTSRASICRSVLRTFAEISGLNMVIDPDVQGTVDIVLTDVPWDQALEVILRGNSARLHRRRHHRPHRAASRRCAASRMRARSWRSRRPTPARSRVRTYTLSYAKADQAAPLVKSSVLSPRGNVQIDARTNTLIITDLPARLDTVQQLLGDASIGPSRRSKSRPASSPTTRDYARALGVQWGFNGRVDSTIGNTTGLAFPNNGSLGGRRRASRGRHGTDPRASRSTAPAPPSTCRWCPTSRRPARSGWRWDRSTAR